MKILLLVNGAPASAAGDRARALSSRWDRDWQIALLYRQVSKWRALGEFIRRGWEFKPEVIYIMDTAYSGVLAGLALKIVRRCRVIVDTGDAAYALAKSTGNYKRWQVALVWLVETIALRMSNWIIVRGSFHKEHLDRVGYSCVTFVPDGVERPDDSEEADGKLRQQLDLDGCFVVGLVGTMIWSQRHRFCYGWDVVQALAHLSDLPVKALLVGDGDGEARLRMDVLSLGVSDRVVFAGRISSAEVGRYLALMDVCVSTQSNDLVGNVRTTGKLPLYLSHRRYVVATSVGEARKVLPGVGSLLSYEGVKDEDYPRRLALEIRRLILHPGSLASAQLGPEVVQKTFLYENLAARAQGVIAGLAN